MDERPNDSSTNWLCKMTIYQLTAMWHDDVPQMTARREVNGLSSVRSEPRSAPMTPWEEILKFKLAVSTLLEKQWHLSSKANSYPSPQHVHQWVKYPQAFLPIILVLLQHFSSNLYQQVPRGYQLLPLKKSRKKKNNWSDSQDTREKANLIVVITFQIFYC